MVQILPGVDEYLSKGLDKLDNTLSLLMPNNREFETQLRNMLIENPELIQTFADIEAQAPDTLQNLGFGRLADVITKTPESIPQAVQRGSRDDLVRAGAAGAGMARRTGEFNVEAFDKILGELGLPEEIADAMRTSLGLPTQLERERTELEMSPIRREAQTAEMLMESAERGEDVAGDIGGLAQRFYDGEVDSQSVSALLSHPTLGPQFEAQLEIIGQKAAQDFQREIAELGATRSSNIPVSLTNQIISTRQARSTIDEYKKAVEDWYNIPDAQKAALKLNPAYNAPMITSDGKRTDLQQIYGRVQSTQKMVLGMMRATLLPGPLSRDDKRILNQVLGDPTSLSAIIRDKSYIDGKINNLEVLMQSHEQAIWDMVRMTTGGMDSSMNPMMGSDTVDDTMEDESALIDIPEGATFSDYELAPDFTPTDFQRLLDTMIRRGLSDEEALNQLVNQFKVLVPKRGGGTR